MTRLLLILFLAILLSLLGTWFYANPGTIVVTWMDTRLTVDVWVGALALVAFFLCIHLLVKALRWVMAIPGFMKDRWNRKTTAKTEGNLLDMISAYYAGEWGEGLRVQKKLAKKMADSPLFNWYGGLLNVAAQHHADAELAFVKLGTKKGGDFLSLRGQVDDCMARGDLVIARDLLERARVLRSKSPWVLKTLFKVYTQTKHYEAAEPLVDLMEDLHILTSAEAKKTLANVQFERSQLATTSALKREEFLRQAHYLDPGRSDITLQLAALLMQEDHKHHARSAAEATWKLSPCRELGRLYMTFFPGKTPVEVYERLISLIDAGPQSDTAYLVRAEGAINAKLWGEARGALNKISQQTLASSALLADIEIRENNNLTKALEILKEGCN